MNLTDYFSAGNDGNITLIFGVFLMFGVLGGILANRIKWMPTITAFMLLGFMIGPYGLGLVSKDMLTRSAVVATGVTATSTGSVSQWAASAAIGFGMVAEKSRVWRLAGTSLEIRFSAWMKPRSSIWSATSSTRASI